MTNMFFPEGMDPIFSYLVPIPKTISRFTFFREFPFFLFWVYSHFLLTGFVWLISKCFLNYPALSVVWNYISFFTVFYRFVGIGRVELERESGVGRRPSSAQLQSRPHARDVVHVRRQSRRRLLRRSRRRLSNVSRLRPSRREWRKSHLNIKQQQHAVVVVVVIDKWKVLSLPGIKIWIPGKGIRGRLILFLLWIGSSAWNISRTFVKGENSRRERNSCLPSRSTCTKAEPLQISFVQVHWWIMGVTATTTQVYKGQKWKGKNRKSYFSRCELEGN